MNDKQKAFMEAYDALKSYAKKYPFLTKMFTDAEANLLRQAKEICQVLATFTDNATGDNNQFKAQTVAFKKPNPDPIPDPDDDDPNTIKESLFLQVLLGSKNGPYEGYLVELRTSLSSITAPSETISLTNIQSHATKKSQNAFSPIGKVFWDNVIILCGDSNNTTKGTFAAALSQQINGYTKSFLENHYAKNVKSYKKDAQPYGDVDAADLAADIPKDTTFIETAADAYEKEAKAKAEAYQKEEEAKINNQNVETNKDAFVQYTSDFLNELVLGLKTCEQENYTIDIPKILTTWRVGLEIKVKGNFQPFLPLLKSIESLGKTTTANAFYAAVKSTIEKEFSLEKLKLMAPQCADCDFKNMLPLERAKQYVQVVLNEKNVLQDAFVKIWIDRQIEWINSIPEDANEFTGFSIKKLKELESDFQNAKFWFKDFKSALDKTTKDSISTSELKLLLNSVRKDAAALEKEFSNCLEEQKNNTKNFVDSLSLFLPAGKVFLLSANYKPTTIKVKVNPTPAELSSGIKEPSSMAISYRIDLSSLGTEVNVITDMLIPMVLEDNVVFGRSFFRPDLKMGDDVNISPIIIRGIGTSDSIKVTNVVHTPPKGVANGDNYVSLITFRWLFELPSMEFSIERTNNDGTTFLGDWMMTTGSVALGTGAGMLAVPGAGWLAGGIVGGLGIINYLGGSLINKFLADPVTTSTTRVIPASKLALDFTVEFLSSWFWVGSVDMLQQWIGTPQFLSANVWNTTSSDDVMSITGQQVSPKLELVSTK